MEAFRRSLVGISQTVFKMLGGENSSDDSSSHSERSSEIIECKSDCSQCDSDNRSISLPSSKDSKSLPLKHGSKKMKTEEQMVSSQRNSSKIIDLSANKERLSN